MKQCTKCKQVKNIDDFAKNRSNASGIHSWCKKCMTDKVLEYRGGRVFEPIKKNKTHKQCRLCKETNVDVDSRKAYCEKCFSEKNHKRNIKLKFKITSDQYNDMLKNQGYVCAICKTSSESRRLSVDHDHNCCPDTNTCGKCIRSLICHRCNLVLGQVNDDASILKSMIDYIKNY